VSRPVALCSFSGGKDSCFALWQAQRQGVLDIRTLLVMFEESGERSRSHAIPLPLIERQARSMRLELLTRNASWKTYEAVFVTALRELQADGHEVAVFGDIDLQAHRDWEERVCMMAGLRAELPLWHRDRATLAQAIIDAGFRAQVVCTDSRYLPDEYCGREYDAQFIRDLPPGVDACGENGEFHTFVFDGPNFRAPVQFAIAEFQTHAAPPEYGGVRYRFAQLT
jgi:uncharacterized protein (TIGR00290 family)